MQGALTCCSCAGCAMFHRFCAKRGPLNQCRGFLWVHVGYCFKGVLIAPLKSCEPLDIYRVTMKQDSVACFYKGSKILSTY
jgi:hypothetical protein